MAFVGQAIRRKGWVRGLVSSALDAIPFVGAAKAGVELVRGDLFPDRVPAGPASPDRVRTRS